MPKKSTDTKPAEKPQVKKAAKKTAEPEAKVVKKASAKTAAAETKPKSAKKTAAGATKATKTAAKPKKAAAALSPEQIEEHVRVAAYYRWEQRGKIEGQHDQDWIEAEKEIGK